MKKDVEVRCPCCGTLLLVDVLTGTVLRHKRAATKESGPHAASLDDVARGVAERKRHMPGAFESAVDEVRSRRAGLEGLFERAVQKEKDNPEPDNPEPRDDAAKGGGGDATGDGSEGGHEKRS